MEFYLNFLFSNKKNVRPLGCQDCVTSKKGQNREENKTARGLPILSLSAGFAAVHCVKPGTVRKRFHLSVIFLKLRDKSTKNYGNIIPV
jgi:hypothetical protein